jgi:hypothetical protein
MHWPDIEQTQPRLAMPTSAGTRSQDAFTCSPSTWPPGREFIRRATSPTSVGDPEPASDYIDLQVARASST